MDALYNAAKPRVVAIGGPTATGKTALSVALAKRFGGEIISADSMQIYQGLDVGTAKVTPEQLAALLRQSATSTPNPAALSAVGATFSKEEDSDEDDE